MFGRRRNPNPGTGEKSNEATSPRGPILWDVPVFFGIMFALSVAELGFTVDSFQYLQRKHLWSSRTEKSRLAFLIFSSVRTIMLSAVYIGFHFAQKHFHSMFHTIFLLLSTVFWIVSGVLIKQLWGYKECGGVGQLQGGLNECHELKIIEIIAWVIAAVSIIATFPVVWNSTKRHKRKLEAKHGHRSNGAQTKGNHGWLGRFRNKNRKTTTSA